MVGKKRDNVDRTVLRGSLTERNLARICAQKRPFSFLLDLSYRRIPLTATATEDWPVKCRSPIVSSDEPTNTCVASRRRRDSRSTAIISPSISDQNSTSPVCHESGSAICATRRPQSCSQPECRQKLFLNSSDMPGQPSRCITCFHTCRTRLSQGCAPWSGGVTTS